MNRMKFNPFGTEKFTRKGFFGGTKDSDDSAANPLFQDDEAFKKKQSENAEKMVILRKRIEDAGIPNSILDDGHISYALRARYSGGDSGKAFEYLLFMKDAISGVLRPYDPSTHMLGAVNRGNVTCWLDATLFAMFSNLTSFEPMLHANFDDSKKNRLVILIRLWVNMLRAGKLIEIDLTQEIQETLRSCGWDQAGELCQNDASEAFSFITGTLGLPLLTMEMDIFHEGGSDEADHKIINERLLEVAIPQSNDGVPVRLEDCLEDHFNARVEVMRRAAIRRDTLISRQTMSHSPMSPFPPQSPVPSLPSLPSLPPLSPDSPNVEDEKPAVLHHEIKSPEAAPNEAFPILSESPSPFSVSESPQDLRPSISRTLASLRGGQLSENPITTRPGMNRDRATSIIRRIVVPSEDGEERPGPSPMRSSPRPPSVAESTRKGSVRKEVLMPAWQFFRILPWYTTEVPDNDDQVAAHFSKCSPVIGICLKRYGWSAKGVATRSNTIVDIPLQIALPHFIQDELSYNNNDAPVFGNFKMVLQSMVCHRGESVNSGHYISIIRAGRTERPLSAQTPSGGPPAYSEDQWIKLDDLNNPRTEPVSIDDAMKKETPYLLFYQVQPMFGDEPLDVIPPPYQTDEVSTYEPPCPLPYEEEDSMLSARGSQVAINDRRYSVAASADTQSREELSNLNAASAVPPAAPPGGNHKHEVSVAIQEASPLQESSDTGYFSSNNTSESWTKSRISISSDTEPATNSSLNTFGTETLSHSFSEADMDKPHPPFTSSEEPRKSLELDKSTTRLSRAASRLGLGPRGNKSRPPSQHDESRKTGTFSKLNLMRMKEKEEKKEKDASTSKDTGKRSSDNSSADVSVATSTVDLVSNPNSSNTDFVDGEADVRSDKTERPDYAGVEMKSKEKEKEKKKEKHEKHEKEKSEKDKDKDHHHRLSMHRGHNKTASTESAGTEKSKEKPDRECGVM